MSRRALESILKAETGQTPNALIRGLQQLLVLQPLLQVTLWGHGDGVKSDEPVQWETKTRTPASAQ